MSGDPGAPEAVIGKNRVDRHASSFNNKNKKNTQKLQC